jgi:hypothetical protein
MVSSTKQSTVRRNRYTAITEPCFGWFDTRKAVPSLRQTANSGRKTIENTTAYADQETQILDFSQSVKKVLGVYAGDG